jgi:hypothetical protein
MDECKNNSCGEYDFNKPFNCAEGQLTFTICTLKANKVTCDTTKTYTSDELYLSPEEFNRRCKPIIDEAMTKLANAIVDLCNEESKTKTLET